MISLYRIILVVILCIVIKNSAQAEHYKIGFVNAERLFFESPAALEAEKKLKKEFSQRAIDLNKAKEEIKTMALLLEDKIIKNAAQENELKKLEESLDENITKFMHELNQRSDEELAKIQKKLDQDIVEFSEHEKFNLILQKAVYISPKMDITNTILSYLKNKPFIFDK